MDLQQKKLLETIYRLKYVNTALEAEIQELTERLESKEKLIKKYKFLRKYMFKYLVALYTISLSSTLLFYLIYKLIH